VRSDVEWPWYVMAVLGVTFCSAVHIYRRFGISCCLWRNSNIQISRDTCSVSLRSVGVPQVWKLNAENYRRRTGRLVGT
jgi:hypothetical protein